MTQKYEIMALPILCVGMHASQGNNAVYQICLQFYFFIFGEILVV